MCKWKARSRGEGLSGKLTPEMIPELAEFPGKAEDSASGSRVGFLSWNSAIIDHRSSQIPPMRDASQTPIGQAAQTPMGQASQTLLTEQITGVPRFETQLVNLQLHKEGTAHFECRVLGHPAPEIIWSRYGTPMLQTARFEIW